MRIEIQQEYDDQGELEEFTWDLFPIVDAERTLHLDEDGLPKPGTMITPGMIIVGKIAKTLAYDPQNQPSSMEIQSGELDAIRGKYGRMWRDCSKYADESIAGVVESAHLESAQHGLRAIVVLRPV